MTISRVTGVQATGAAAGAVACAAGDLIKIFAYRDGNTTPPSLAAGFQDIASSGGNTNSARIAYKIATGTSEDTGTWANATKVIAEVYRTSLLGSGYSLAPGAFAAGGATSTTVNYPALALQDASGSSWVTGDAGHRSVDTNVQNAPAGMTNRQATNNTTAEAASHDTNGGVTSWPSTNVSVGGTSSGWRSYVLEIKEVPPPPAGWTVLTKGGATANGTSFNTAAISPTAGAEVLIAINGMGSATTDRKVPESVGDFQLVDYIIIGDYSIGSVWQYKSDTPFSGAVPIDYGSNTQDAISWTVLQRTGVESIGTVAKASATGTSPAPGAISFAGTGAETFVANFWSNSGSASVPAHTPDADFYEFAEQANADSGWFTAVAVNVADDQQTTQTATLATAQTWASIGFEIRLATGGGAAVLEGDALAVASASGSLTGGTALPSIRSGFPVVADGAAAAEPYNVLSAAFSANAGDELVTFAIGGGLPSVISRNSADTGAGVLNWVRRLVTRVDYTNTSTNAAGAQQVAVYSAVVPAGGVTERARYTTAATANDNGDAVNPNLPARLIVVAVDNTNGIGAINWRGSVGGTGSEVTTGQAATQTIKPFGLNSLLLGAGWFINGTAPTPASGCTEVVAPGTNRMPLYSRIGGTAGTAVALGSAATDGTLWALGLVEYLPTSTPKPARKILVIGDSNVESTHAALSVVTHVQDALAPDFEVFQQGVWWAHVAQCRSRWDAVSATLPAMDVALVNIGTNDVNETLAWSAGNQTDMTAIFSGLEAAGMQCAVFTGIGPLAGAGAPQAYYDARNWLTANAPDGSHLWSIDPVADPAQNYLAVDADYLSADAKHINSAGSTILGADLVTWIQGLTFSASIELSGAAITVASASGQLTTQIPLAGTAISLTGAGASLSAQIRLSGAALSTALASAGLTTGAGLAGSALAAAGATAILTTTILMTGAAVGQSGAPASLTTQTRLDGAALAQASATGTLEIVVSLSGAAAALASAAGGLSTQIALDGDALAAASASGGLLTAIMLAGSGSAESDAQASLTAQIRLAAVAMANAGASGQLTTQIPLSGVALAISTANGDITAHITLSGAALAVALGSADLTSGSGLSGAALAGATAAAALTTSILITAGAGAQAGAIGELTTQILLDADALARAAATGSLEVEIPLAGAALSNASATGQLSTGIALVGIATANATAGGALGQGQSLAGAAVALTSADGNLTAQIRLSAEAMAEAIASGSLAATILLSGQALALASAAGALTKPINLAGAALNEASAVGALTTQIALSGHAAAQASASGMPWLDILLAGAATVTASASAVLTTPPRLVAVAFTGSLGQILFLDSAIAPVAHSESWSSPHLQLNTEPCHV